MDPVNRKALKGKFKDRADKDIDNDGDVDSSDEYLHKRRKAISKAIGKIKEELELDEAAPKMKGDFIKTQREKDKAHADAMGRHVKSGRKKTMTSTQRSLASMRKEEVELDEAEMSLYDKIKAARANPSLDKPVRGRGSKNRNPKTYDVRNTLDKEDDRLQAKVKKKLKKEEVELDEVSTEKLRDYASAALQDKNKAKADKRWKYVSKAMNTVGDREAKAAHALKYNKKD